VRFYTAAWVFGLRSHSQDESSAAFAQGTYTLWLYADAKLAHSLVHIAFTAATVRRSMRFTAKAQGARPRQRPPVRATTTADVLRRVPVRPDGNNVEAVCLK